MMLDLVRRIIQGLNFDGGRTRVGLVTFSDVATVRFHLNTYTSKLEVLTAIAFTQEKGRTYTAAGLDTVKHTMFSSTNGDRAGDPNTVIVITDGRSNVNAARTIPAADELRNNGVEVYAIGEHLAFLTFITAIENLYKNVYLFKSSSIYLRVFVLLQVLVKMAR